MSDEPLSLEVLLSLPHTPPLRYVFNRSPILVGRGARCELCLPLSTISAQHLSLSWGAQGLCVRDLNAKNKAELRGEPLVGERCDPSALTLSLPGALIEARLTPQRLPESSHEQRALHLLQILGQLSGWLIEWRPHPTSSSPREVSSDHPGDPLEGSPPLTSSPQPSPHALTPQREALIPLTFGERLKLRAQLSQAEGLPQALLGEPSSGEQLSDKVLKGEKCAEGVRLEALELHATQEGVEVSDEAGVKRLITPTEPLSLSTGELRLVSAQKLTSNERKARSMSRVTAWRSASHEQRDKRLRLVLTLLLTFLLIFLIDLLKRLIFSHTM